MTKCRDCALYDLDAVKDKAGRVRSDRVARCLWVSTEPAPLSFWNWRPSGRIRMLPDDGEGCPCFKPREGDTQ